MKLWGGRASRAEVYGLFLAAVVLVGGGIGGAFALTSDVPSPSASDASSETETTEGSQASPTSSPTEDEGELPSPEPTMDIPACDSVCQTEHIQAYLASARLATRAHSASDPRLCLQANCGDEVRNYCIIGAQNLVENCIVWNGWGDGWLNLYAQGRGLDPSEVFIVDANAGSGIRLSPGQPVSYVFE